MLQYSLLINGQLPKSENEKINAINVCIDH